MSTHQKPTFQCPYFSTISTFDSFRWSSMDALSAHELCRRGVDWLSLSPFRGESNLLEKNADATIPTIMPKIPAAGPTIFTFSYQGKDFAPLFFGGITTAMFFSYPHTTGCFPTKLRTKNSLSSEQRSPG